MMEMRPVFASEALLGLAAANAAFDFGAAMLLRYLDAPAQGTPEELARLEELRGQVRARNIQVQALPIREAVASVPIAEPPPQT